MTAGLQDVTGTGIVARQARHDSPAGRRAQATVYRAGGVIYRLASMEDDAALRAMLRDGAMASWVTVSSEREPCFFHGESLMGDSFTVVARAEDHHRTPVGMYSGTFLSVHVNGERERLGYLGGLRVSPRFRHRLRILRNGFDSVRLLLPERGTLPYWFTSLASENAPARRLLQARLPGMPVYRPVGELETLVLDVRQGRRTGLLQQATHRDVPALVEFFNRQSRAYQFASVLEASRLLAPRAHPRLAPGDFWLLKDGGDVRGCLAVWDQRSCKQVVVQGYRFPWGALRGAYNAWACATRRARLPAPGNRLEHAFLAFVAFDGASADICLDAVREALVEVRDRGAQAGVLGLSPDNPLAAVVKSKLRAHVYRTCIETVTWPGGAEPRLDGRPPQPEAALL